MAAEPHYIDVDLKKKTQFELPTVTQNDTDTVFILRVTDDGRSDNDILSDFSTITLTSERGDRQAFYVAGVKIPDTNEVEFNLGTKELELTGRVTASVQFYSVDGRKSSAHFYYNVEKDLTGEYVPTETEVTLIETVLVDGPARIAEAVAAKDDALEAAAFADNVRIETEAERLATEAVRLSTEESKDAADQSAATANTSAENADLMATAAEEAAALATQEAEDARTQKELVEEVLSTGPVASVNGQTGLVTGLATQASVDQVNQQLAEKEEQLNDISYNVKTFGAVGNGVADDTQSIKSAILSIQGIEGATLHFPKATKYNVSEQITFPTTLNVLMDSPIEYTGTANIPVLVFGEASKTIRNKTLMVQVFRKTIAWADENDIGVKIINADTCKIEIKNAQRFTIGAQFIGSTGGFAYNEIILGFMYQNKYGVDCTNEQGGWCNENNFYGGRFSNYSSTMVDASRYGVRITSKDGVYDNNNNNVFYKPSFELKVPSIGEAVPVVIESGTLNSFDNARCEDNSLVLFRVKNKANANHFNVGFGQTGVFENLSEYSTNTLSKKFHKVTDIAKLIYNSGKLTDALNPYDDTQNYLKNVHFRFHNSSSRFMTRASTSLLAESNHVQISSGNGLCVYVDTEKNKKISVSKDSIAGFDGRIGVLCFDQNNEILTSSNTLKSNSDGGLVMQPLLFSGAFCSSVDRATTITFEVSSHVKRVEIILFAFGSNVMKLKSFSIYTIAENGVFNSGTIWNEYSTVFNNESIAIKAPTFGTFVKGKFIRNANPIEMGVTGSKYIVSGWVCIVSGTPGTWLEQRYLTGN